MVRFTSGVGLLVLLSALRVWAGATMVFQEGASGGGGKATTVYVDGGRIRMETETARGPMIFQWDGAKKTLRRLNPTRKVYTEVNEENFAEMKQRLDAVMQQLTPAIKQRMERETENLPADERKQVLAKLAEITGEGRQALQWSFEKTGKKAEVAGYSCEHYKGVEKTTGATRDVCAVPWDASPLGADDRKAFTDMAEYFGKLASVMPQQMILDPSKLPGFPASLQGRDKDGSPRHEETLKSARKGPVPAEQFAVPAGYTKESLRIGK